MHQTGKPKGATAKRKAGKRDREKGSQKEIEQNRVRERDL